MKVFRVVDFETTGWPPNASLVEVAYTDVIQQDDGNILFGPTKSQLTSADHPINIEARAVHHISPEMLKFAPHWADVVKQLEMDARKMPAFFAFCAHNAQFERKFFEPPGLKWICTQKVAQILWPESPKHTNQVLRYFLQIDIDAEHAEPAHRAGPDTYVTARILAEALNLMSPEDMVKATGEPTLLAICSFGKHKNVPWSQVPKDYLRWILSNDQYNDQNVKHTAAYWLTH